MKRTAFFIACIAAAVAAGCAPKSGSVAPPSSLAPSESPVAATATIGNEAEQGDITAPADGGTSSAAAGAAAGSGDSAIAATDVAAPPPDGKVRASGAGKGSAGMAPSTPDGARERIVELDREPGAPPLVPGFPAARQHKVMAGLDTVHFSFDSSTLSEESKAVLRKNAAWLRSHPGISLRLMGHADERGSSEYNLALGLRRAHMVRDYLIELGIAPDGMNSISYGEEMPMKRGHDEASWRVNRRVEFAQAEATAALRR